MEKVLRFKQNLSDTFHHENTIELTSGQSEEPSDKPRRRKVSESIATDRLTMLDEPRTKMRETLLDNQLGEQEQSLFLLAVASVFLLLLVGLALYISFWRAQKRAKRSLLTPKASYLNPSRRNQNELDEAIEKRESFLLEERRCERRLSSMVTFKRRLARGSTVIASRCNSAPKVRLIKARVRKFIDEEAAELEAKRQLDIEREKRGFRLINLFAFLLEVLKRSSGSEDVSSVKELRVQVEEQMELTGNECGHGSTWLTCGTGKREEEPEAEKLSCPTTNTGEHSLSSSLFSTSPLNQSYPQPANCCPNLSPTCCPQAERSKSQGHTPCQLYPKPCCSMSHSNIASDWQSAEFAYRQQANTELRLRFMAAQMQYPATNHQRLIEGSKCNQLIKRQYENYYDDERDDAYRHLTMGVHFGHEMGHCHPQLASHQMCAQSQSQSQSQSIAPIAAQLCKCCNKFDKPSRSPFQPMTVDEYLSCTNPLCACQLNQALNQPMSILVQQPSMATPPPPSNCPKAGSPSAEPLIESLSPKAKFRRRRHHRLRMAHWPIRPRFCAPARRMSIAGDQLSSEQHNWVQLAPETSVNSSHRPSLDASLYEPNNKSNCSSSGGSSSGIGVTGSACTNTPTSSLPYGSYGFDQSRPDQSNLVAYASSRKLSLPAQLESNERLSPSSRRLFERNLELVEAANLLRIGQANKPTNQQQQRLVDSRRSSQTITRQSSFWLEDNTVDSVLSLTTNTLQSEEGSQAEVNQLESENKSMASLILSADSIESVKKRPSVSKQHSSSSSSANEPTKAGPSKAKKSLKHLKNRLSSSSTSSTSTSSPSPDFSRPSERILAPKSSNSISKRHYFSRLKAKRYPQDTKRTTMPTSYRRHKDESDDEANKRSSDEQSASNISDLGYPIERPTAQTNSASMERQCRELWKLRAALQEDSCVGDDWANYHQRLNRRYDSGYKSIENQFSSSLEANALNNQQVDLSIRPPSGCSTRPNQDVEKLLNSEDTDGPTQTPTPTPVINIPDEFELEAKLVDLELDDVALLLSEQRDCQSRSSKSSNDEGKRDNMTPLN